MHTIFACGRLNPPHLGHAWVLAEVATLASLSAARPRLFVTRTRDRLRNPLPLPDKLALVRTLFPGFSPSDCLNAFEAGERLARDGTTHATLVVGADREALGRAFAAAGTKLGLLQADYRLVAREPGTPSGTAVRAAVLAGDEAAFAAAMPPMTDTQRDTLYRALRRGMGDEWP